MQGPDWQERLASELPVGQPGFFRPHISDQIGHGQAKVSDGLLRIGRWPAQPLHHLQPQRQCRAIGFGDEVPELEHFQAGRAGHGCRRRQRQHHGLGHAIGRQRLCQGYDHLDVAATVGHKQHLFHG